MTILTKDDLLETLSDIIRERYEPAINSAINNMSKHHKLGDDTKRTTGSDVFGGFIFKLAEKPKPEESEDNKETE